MLRSFALLLTLAVTQLTQAAIPVAPDRHEGEGPYTQLILRGVTFADTKTKR